MWWVAFLTAPLSNPGFIMGTHLQGPSSSSKIVSSYFALLFWGSCGTTSWSAFGGKPVVMPKEGLFLLRFFIKNWSSSARSLYQGPTRGRGFGLELCSCGVAHFASWCMVWGKNGWFAGLPGVALLKGPGGVEMNGSGIGCNGKWNPSTKAVLWVTVPVKEFIADNWGGMVGLLNMCWCIWTLSGSRLWPNKVSALIVVSPAWNHCTSPSSGRTSWCCTVCM